MLPPSIDIRIYVSVPKLHDILLNTFHNTVPEMDKRSNQQPEDSAIQTECLAWHHGHRKMRRNFFGAKGLWDQGCPNKLIHPTGLWTQAGSTVEVVVETNWDQSARPFQLLELSVWINSHPHISLPPPSLEKHLNKGGCGPSSTELHNFLC